MELDQATIINSLALFGIIALLGWAWRINTQLAKLKGDVEHGFKDGRKTMKRHSEKIETHDDELRALQITAAENRGRGSNPSLRPHHD